MPKILLQILDTPAGEQFDRQVRSYGKYMGKDVCKFPELVESIKKIDTNIQCFEHFSKYMKWGIRKLEYSFIFDNLISNSCLRVLDVGSGVTILPHVISRMGNTVDALDPAPSWKLANTEIGRLYNSFYESNVRYINDYLFSIQGNEIYDEIISVSVLEHLPHREIGPTLDKMVALLKPGGRLILTIDYCPRAKYYKSIIKRFLPALSGPFSYYDFRRIIHEHLPERGDLVDLWRQDRAATSCEKFWLSHAFEGCLYQGSRPYLSLGISCTKS